MKKNLIKLSMAIALGAMLAACEPPTPTVTTTEGTIAELSCNRTEIYRAQPITFTGDYTPGQGIDASLTTCEVTAVNQAGEHIVLPLPSHASIENGKVVAYVTCLPVGDITVKVTISESVKLGETKEISKTAQVTVKDGQPDIRNCSWGDSQEITIENIKFYPFYTWSKSDKTIKVEEEDYYYHDYSNIAGAEKGAGIRNVYYDFENNHLADIQYIVRLKKEEPDNMSYIVRFFTQHETQLSRDYYGISDFVRSAKKIDAYTPTPEVSALITKFKDGSLTKDDNTTPLAEAVQAGNVMLEINAGNAKNNCKMLLEKNVNGNTPVISIYFTPKK